MAALAYLDPGSGSLVLQLVLGGIAGAAGAIKLFGSRFRRRRAPAGDTADTAAQETEQG